MTQGAFYIEEVNGQSYANYASGLNPKPLAYLFLDPALENSQVYIATIEHVAVRYKSNFAKALNLVEAAWPAFVIQDLQKGLKYPFDQTRDVTVQGVTEWVEHYLAGKLQPFLRSQPIPQTQDESVFTFVGKNFEEAVYDDRKNFFVAFYSSRCPFSERLMPIWHSLGDKYACMKSHLMIAKMEAPENDLPLSTPFRISGFPTIKFKPARSCEFIDYEGGRSLESLVSFSFIKTHAKHSIDQVEIPLEIDNAVEER